MRKEIEFLELKEIIKNSIEFKETTNCRIFVIKLYLYFDEPNILNFIYLLKYLQWLA